MCSLTRCCIEQTPIVNGRLPSLNRNPPLNLRESKSKITTKIKGLFMWVLLLLAFASGCGKPTQRANCDLPIYFTCDTRGRLEPCGCFDGQFGGLTRLKTVLDDEAPVGAL